MNTQTEAIGAVLPVQAATIAGPREAMQTGITWIKTYASALLEWMGMMLVLRLGAALCGQGGIPGLSLINRYIPAPGIASDS
jgi:hypothetical protein